MSSHLRPRRWTLGAPGRELVVCHRHEQTPGPLGAPTAPVAVRGLIERLPRDLFGHAQLRQMAEAVGFVGSHSLDFEGPLRQVFEALDRGTLVVFEAPRFFGFQPLPLPPKLGPPRPIGPEPREITSFVATPLDLWCGDFLLLRGTTRSFSDGEKIQVEIQPAKGKGPTRLDLKVSQNSFIEGWRICDVLPDKKGAHFAQRVEVRAAAGGIEAPLLKVHFAPTAAKQPYRESYARFELGVLDYCINVESQLEYVKGWGAEVVYLGDAAKPDTGGEIEGFDYSGCRWMKTGDSGEKQFWNGKGWQDLPEGFKLKDINNHAIGLYESGGKYISQHGGEWPEASLLHAWDVNGDKPQATLKKWTLSIHDTWTHRFDIKRKDCSSADSSCCRYSFTVEVKFVLSDRYTKGKIVVAAGNIRSNSELWFLGEPRPEVAAHEFGHHLGNPDEYEGATSVEGALNEDGANNGIDKDSIMGQNLTVVKKRHFRTVIKHLTTVMKSATDKTFHFEAVKPL